MKKSFIIIIFTLSSFVSRAQFSVITPEIGLTLSTGRELSEFKYKPGYLYGISVAYKLSSTLSLVPGFFLEQKREKFEFPAIDSNGMILPAQEYYTYNYLCLPMRIEVHPFINKNIFFDVGLYAGYLRNVKAKLKIDSEENYGPNSTLDISHFGRKIFGLCIGGGILIPVNTHGEIKIGIHYENRLSKAVQLLDINFKTFSFSTGYSFRIGK